MRKMNPKRRKQYGADILVFSVGKSGRTWLRVLLNKYFSLKYDIPFAIDDLRKSSELVPGIVYDHELWLHHSEATFWERLRGKMLIPDRVVFGKKLLVLYRDPRDTVVSLYFQMTRRSVKNRCDSSIGSFIRDRRYGIGSVVKTLNLWRKRFGNHPRCLWLSYEALRADTLAELTRLLEFVEAPGAVDAAAAAQAVRFSEFENMRRMEQRGDFNSTMLTPADVSDNNSYKVREGKVRGYVKHFSADDLRYLDEATRTLDQAYGYPPDSTIPPHHAMEGQRT